MALSPPDAVGEASPDLSRQVSPVPARIRGRPAHRHRRLHGAGPPRRRRRHPGRGGARRPRLGDVVLSSVAAASDCTAWSGRRRAGWRTKADRAPTWDPVSERSRPHRHRDRGAERRQARADAAREAAAAVAGRGGGGPPPRAVGPSRPALTPPQLSDVFTRSDRIVGRRIAGEYVLVPLVGRGTDADFIYTLNRVAAAIWEALDGKASGDGCRPPGGRAATRSRRRRPPPTTSSSWKPLNPLTLYAACEQPHPPPVAHRDARPADPDNKES